MRGAYIVSSPLFCPWPSPLSHHCPQGSRVVSGSCTPIHPKGCWSSSVISFYLVQHRQLITHSKGGASIRQTERRDMTPLLGLHLQCVYHFTYVSTKVTNLRVMHVYCYRVDHSLGVSSEVLRCTLNVMTQHKVFVE